MAIQALAAEPLLVVSDTLAGEGAGTRPERIGTFSDLRTMNTPISRARLWHRGQELVKFGSVGAIAYLVDLGIFNLMLLGFATSPIVAKIISVAIATIVAWIGNRLWTFRDRRTTSRSREFGGFALVNVGGLLIGVLCLWISHYILGFTSPLADNISGNVIGLGLGTLFRYIAYRRWVFTG